MLQLGHNIRKYKRTQDATIGIQNEKIYMFTGCYNSDTR